MSCMICNYKKYFYFLVKHLSSFGPKFDIVSNQTRKNKNLENVLRDILTQGKYT